MAGMTGVRSIVVATAWACGLSTAALAVDGVREISEACAITAAGAGCFPGDAPGPPVTINQAGSYVLTSNLTIVDPDIDAIQILVNDVTLDLNGHSIRGPNTGAGNGNGIYAENRFNLTIRNGRVWGFGLNGIDLEVTAGDPSSERAGHRIEAMHVSSNLNGIRLEGGLVIDSTVDGNRAFGVTAAMASVRDSTANKNVFDGFRLLYSSAANCVAVGNGQDGFGLFNSSLSGCVASKSGRYGVYVNHSTVTQCRAEGNTSSGISMGLGAINGGNHVFRNSASENQGADQIFCANNGTDNICVDNATF